MKELEDKVNKIPELLEKEYARGKEETTSEIEKDDKYNMELLKKDYQNTIDRQKDKIETLEKELDKINEEKISIQNKLDQSYVQIKEIATKTVETAGSVKIFENNASDTNKI